MTKYGDLEYQDVPVRMTPTVKTLVTTTAAPRAPLVRSPDIYIHHALRAVVTLAIG